MQMYKVIPNIKNSNTTLCKKSYFQETEKKARISRESV